MRTLPRQENRHCSVIVVEDSHTDARLILQALLQDDHHLQVTVLTDGDRAASHVHQPDWDAPPFHQPDLVLLDLSLPGKDGMEVLSDLKSTPQLKGVPIVVFTGTDQPESVQRCYALGANCVAFKPVETRPFIDTVKSIGRYWLDVVGPRAHARARAEAWRGKLPPELDEIP